jgi:hypothetical protein
VLGKNRRQRRCIPSSVTALLTCLRWGGQGAGMKLSQTGDCGIEDQGRREELVTMNSVRDWLRTLARQKLEWQCGQITRHQQGQTVVHITLLSLSTLTYLFQAPHLLLFRREEQKFSNYLGISPRAPSTMKCTPAFLSHPVTRPSQTRTVRPVPFGKKGWPGRPTHRPRHLNSSRIFCSVNTHGTGSALT